MVDLRDDSLSMAFLPWLYEWQYWSFVKSNISATIASTGMILCRDNHGPHRMNPTHFCNTLALSPWHFLLLVKPVAALAAYHWRCCSEHIPLFACPTAGNHPVKGESGTSSSSHTLWSLIGADNLSILLGRDFTLPLMMEGTQGL